MGESIRPLNLNPVLGTIQVVPIIVPSSELLII
jgi:hypothetical protein